MLQPNRLWTTSTSLFFSLSLLACQIVTTSRAQLPPSAVDSLLTPNRTIIVGQAPAAGSEAGTATLPVGKVSTQVIGAEGPWGQLKYYPVFLEAASSLVEQFPLPNSRSRWAFPASFRAGLPEFLKNAGLSASFVDALMAPGSLVAADEMVYVFPPLSMLEAMTPEQRAVVYAELRKYPQNEFHVEPVLIPSGNVEEWFHTSELRPEIVQRIKNMCYKRGDTLAFSDMAAIMNHSTGEAESRDIMKACTRTRALVVKLKVNAMTDVPKIIDYWTTGLNLRRKDIEPLLKSVIETDGVESIDIVHIIPPLPRKLLMSYPDSGMSKDGILPDCHWTSLNFFNYDPQPYLLDSRLATSAVLERFVPVKEPYRYGDILFFLDNKNGDAFHSCVYLADDIVFSKNGRNVLSPWIFTTLTDLKKIYLYEGNGRVQGYRNKSSPALPK